MIDYKIPGSKTKAIALTKAIFNHNHSERINQKCLQLYTASSDCASSYKQGRSCINSNRLRYQYPFLSQSSSNSNSNSSIIPDSNSNRNSNPTSNSSFRFQFSVSSMLQCYNAAVLQCSVVGDVVLQCCSAPVLIQLSSASVFQCFRPSVFQYSMPFFNSSVLLQFSSAAVLFLCSSVSQSKCPIPESPAAPSPFSISLHPSQINAAK